MYAIAAAIAFFVAFLIKTIFTIINAAERKRLIGFLNFKRLETVEIQELQREAENPGKEGEIHAVIALALYLYLMELHDRESEVITINKVARTYSPWSSKIYGLNQWKR